MMTLQLVDGRLYNEKAEEVFADADYFTTVEEARRWLDENQIDATVVEADAV